MEVKWSSDCHCKIIFSGGRIGNTRPSSETETRKSARSGSSSTGHRPENTFRLFFSLINSVSFQLLLLLSTGFENVHRDGTKYCSRIFGKFIFPLKAIFYRHIFAPKCWVKKLENFATDQYNFLPIMWRKLSAKKSWCIICS